MLDRLVGGTVLAEADRVVRPYEGDRNALDGGQPDRVLEELNGFVIQGFVRRIADA